MHDTNHIGSGVPPYEVSGVDPEYMAAFTNVKKFTKVLSASDKSIMFGGYIIQHDLGVRQCIVQVFNPEGEAILNFGLSWPREGVVHVTEHVEDSLVECTVVLLA
jgi:hypothetical protein